MIENYADALRDYEVEAGHIDRALAVMLPARMLARDFTYPALAFGRHIPMGRTSHCRKCSG